MDSGFKPARRPAKSLRQTLDERSAETKTPDTETFQTPEQVAAEDDLSQAASSVDIDLPEDPTPPTSGNNLFDKIKHKIKSFSQKEWAVTVAVVVVCGSLVGFGLSKLGDKPVVSAKPVVVKKVVAPKVVPSTLSGLPVDPSLNTRPVTAVMIENSLDARPQSGLSESNVVFEAIAEGGITRFLALFQDTAPGSVGPVRSARPYYMQWELGFDANYAHVGGSPEALASIGPWGVRDLDQFANSGSYHRIPNRAAPHNVYTSIDALIQLGASKGYNTSTFSGFVRKKAAPAAVPNPKTIDLAISGPSFNVHYDYVAATNSYNRSEGGAAHVDATNNKVISPNVVVALVVPYGLNGKYSVYQTIGSGQAFVFQDGALTVGTWTKTSEKSQITFTDAAGKPLGLNPGQTWLTAVGDASKVTYAP